MYSEILRDHALNPRNQRALEAPDSRGQSFYKRCGDSINLYLRIEDEIIQEATFTGKACAPAIAAASLATTLLEGLSVSEARQIDAFQLHDALGGLPLSKRHALLLILECLSEALGPRIQNPNEGNQNHVMDKTY